MTELTNPATNIASPNPTSRFYSPPLPPTFLIQLGDFILSIKTKWKPHLQFYHPTRHISLSSYELVMSLDLDALSDSEIVTLCENPAVRINSTKVARGLAKLSDEIAVKFGWEITDEEVANQKFAYEYSLKSNIKVPKIYRFFRVGDKAYIVMDFIEGVTLDGINCREHPGLIDRLALDMESLFSQIPCGPPGPINGGIPRGYLFSEDGAFTTFNSIPKLNKWMNTRLRAKDGEMKFDFTASECIFYHQDLARRNIIMRPDGSFCLVDWEHAGFYPRMCAAYCLRFVGSFDSEFANDLLGALEKLWPKTENRNELLKMLNRVYQNNLRYS